MDQSSLQYQSKFSENMRAQIGAETVVELPFDQLVGKAFDLNLVSPPTPQSYSVYTPLLDRENAEFFAKKSLAPKFILLSRPVAIDYRNPNWEAPLSQLSILCNYRSTSYDENYLLLTRRSNSICNFEKIASGFIGQKGTFANIELVSIEENYTLRERLFSMFFKQIPRDQLIESGRVWKIVHANKNFLILNVPKEIDFPSVWSYGEQNKLDLTPKQRETFSTLVINN
jgi:hypothetical protein